MQSELKLFEAFAGGFLESPESIPFSYCINNRHVNGFENCKTVTTSKDITDSHISRASAVGYDDEAGLVVSVKYCEYREFPVCEWTIYFECMKERSGRISNILGMDGTIFQKVHTLWECNGDFYSSESYTPRYTSLKEELSFSPVGGRSCEGAFPYYRFIGDKGGFLYAIGWPGRWRARFLTVEGGVHICCGQDTIDTYLYEGEIVRSPSNTLLFYSGDENDAINLYRRWFNEHILPKDYCGGMKERIGRSYNGGGVEFTKATNENQLSAIEMLKNSPARPDVWWIDAGWYLCSLEDGSPDWRMTGTWRPDPERFPNGLKEIGNRCEQIGAELLLWFEPERVRRGTELFNEHFEWLVEYEEAPKKGTAEENFLLDIGEPECLKWLKERIGSIIREGNVKIYRQDFNFEPIGYWRAKEGEERKGFIENRYIQALLQFWDDLLMNNPGLHIDAVAAGGRRFDLEVARRAILLHPTDYGYGEHPVKLAFHQVLSEWFTYYRSSVLNWEEGDKYKRGAGKPELSNFVLNCCIAPMIQLEHIDYNETADFEKTAVKVFREAAPFMIWGDYYKLTEYSRRNDIWFARQFHMPQFGMGILQAVRLKDCKEDRFLMRPKALEKNRNYLLRDIENGKEEVISAKELEKGFEIALERRQAKILHYQLT
ncbi:MAG: alpha-galactosidase [Lachnospiraceae bacterium]